MTSSFLKFIINGKIADTEKREALAISILAILKGEKEAMELGFSDKELNGFASALKRILSHEHLLSLTKENETLAEEVTKFLLDFVMKTNRKVQLSDCPHKEEIQTWEKFRKEKEKVLDNEWINYQDLLKSKYPTELLNTDFYDEEFKKLPEKTKKYSSDFNFTQVKEHLSEKWASLLFEKKLKSDMKTIGKATDALMADLDEKCQGLGDYKEAIQGENEENRGKSWNLAKGLWHDTDFDILVHYTKLLQNDVSLKHLAEILGRARTSDEEIEEVKVMSIMKAGKFVEYAAKSELTGITESDDIGNVLPSELAVLATEGMETVFLKRFAEKKLQTFHYQSKIFDCVDEEMQTIKVKKVNKGPLILSIDTSGSMCGKPEEVAKVLAFAILKIALNENRKCYLITFSDNYKSIELEGWENSYKKLMRFLKKSFNGGTEMRPAMEEALRVLQTTDYKEADVLWVSDFIANPFDSDFMEKINEAKANKTLFHSLTIGTDGDRTLIQEFDNQWVYDENCSPVLVNVQDFREN